MRRIIITGRNNMVPQHAFTSSGMTPVARAAGDLRFVVQQRKPDAHTVQRSVSGSSASPRRSIPPVAGGTLLADASKVLA